MMYRPHPISTCFTRAFRCYITFWNRQLGKRRNVLSGKYVRRNIDEILRFLQKPEGQPYPTQKIEVREQR